MCSFLHVTPKDLGRLREKDPLGMIFLERSFIHRRTTEYEAIKKQEEQMKQKGGSGRGKHIRRK